MVNIRKTIVAIIAAIALMAAALNAVGCSEFTAKDSSSFAISSEHHSANDSHGSEHHYSFKNHHALKEHFEKHGAEVGCATEEDYLSAANAVINDPSALHKVQAEDGDDAYFLESTGEFVVVSQKGYIRTYFITNRDYFNSQ